ncbi:MAG: serine hydrolase domain-containing protein [Actinomycetaceae bacterium]|nr:serine hydrolase domain-containing protein [Actinomycetaceae bacterium]
MTRTIRRSCMAAIIGATLMLSACAGGTPNASAPPISSSPPSGGHSSESQSAGAQSASPVRNLTADNVNTWLDGYMPAALESQKIAGATVAVVKDGQVLTTRGFGYADTGKGGSGEAKAVDPEETLFRVASISKIPTSIAVMQLVEDGKIDLDADINTYIDIPIQRRFDSPITVRHLLTHTAGFEEHKGEGTGKESFDLEVGVMTEPPEQVYEPGTTPAYSNYGMNALGLIVQKVSGQRFEDYVKTQIFDPLGMDSTTYEQPVPEHLKWRLSQGYTDSTQSAGAFEVAPQPAGSLTSSAEDFATFMNAHITRDPRILTPQSWEQMWSAAPNEKLGGMQEGERVGLGYMLGERNGHKTAGHGGDTGLFHSWYETYPEQGIGVFVSVNSTGTGTSDIRDDFLERFADQYLTDVSTELEISSEERAQHVQEVSGTYESSRALHSTFFTSIHAAQAVTVSAAPNGNLVIAAGGQASEFVEVKPYVWRAVGGDHYLSADRSTGSPRLNQMGIMTLLPQSPLRGFIGPLSTAGQVLIGAVFALWVFGGIRSGLARHRGENRPTSLPWPGRISRIGGALALAMPYIWMQIMGYIFSSPAAINPPDWWIRLAQAGQLLAVLALIPAIWDLVGAVRQRRGWPRIIVSIALVIGLTLLAWVAITTNTLSPDITY